MAGIPLVAGSIVRFTMHHTGPGSPPMDCVWDVAIDETGVSREVAVADTAPLVVGVYQENLANFLHTAYSFLGATYLDVDSLDGIGGFIGPQSGKPIHGTGSDPLSPPQVNYVVTKQCAHNRRQRNGRMYFPGVAEANVANDGTVLAGVKTALNDACNGFRTDVNDLSATFLETAALRVVHVVNHDSSTGRPNEWSSSDITGFTCLDKVGTQRRRLR